MTYHTLQCALPEKCPKPTSVIEGYKPPIQFILMLRYCSVLTNTHPIIPSSAFSQRLTQKRTNNCHIPQKNVFARLCFDLWLTTELNNETTTSLVCGKERGLKRARLKNAFDSRENQCRVLKTKTFFFYSRHILILNVSRDKNNFWRD